MKPKPATKKDETATARTNRRNAQIEFIIGIVKRNPNTAMIAAVFGKPLISATLVRVNLKTTLMEMVQMVDLASDADIRKAAEVIRDHPRKERRGKRKK